MDIPQLIADLVAMGKEQAETALATVLHYPVLDNGIHGSEYGEPVERQALVEDLADTVTTSDGTDTVSRTKLTFFEPVIVAEGDQFQVPGSDERTNVLKKKSVKDPLGVPYMLEVWLGDARTNR